MSLAVATGVPTTNAEFPSVVIDANVRILSSEHAARSPNSDAAWDILLLVDLATFIAQRENQCLDLDGAYGCQCVDLADAWANNLDHPLPLVEGAKDYAGQTIPGWLWIANGQENFPEPGDLVIWNSQIGPNGHVAICIGPADANTFSSLDQNWFGANSLTGSAAARVPHNYFGVAGWLRPSSGLSASRVSAWDGSHPLPDPPPASTGVDVTYTGRILPVDGGGKPTHWFDGPDGQDMGAAPIGAGVTTSHAVFDGVNWWDRIAPGTWWLLDAAIDGRDEAHPAGQTPVTVWNEAHKPGP